MSKRDEFKETVRYEKIASDKAFDVEVKFATDEINRRMDYNRRTQGFQITTIGLLVAALITKGSTNIDRSMVNAVCVAVSAINGMFLIEIRQNTYAIKLAALYITDVINHKYRLENGNVILEWEHFLDRQRRGAQASILQRLSFVGSAHLLMSLYLTILPIIVFVYDTIIDSEQHFYLELSGLMISSLLNFALIFSYIYSGLELNTTKYFSDFVSFKSAVESDFDYFYDLRKRTMTEHFSRVGKTWGDEELTRHREVFDRKKLTMISLRGTIVGFVNVSSSKHEVLISHFCIEPDQQGSGLGSYVLKCVINEAARERKSIKLDILKKNKALKLYKRFGFKVSPEKHEHLFFMERHSYFLEYMYNRFITFWRRKNFLP